MQRVLVPIRTILRHRDLVVALGCSVLLGLAYSFVLPFFSLFATVEVGMTPWTFGVFMIVTSLSGIGVSTALARWSDTHLSRRTVMLLGSAAGALGYLGDALVRDVVWLTVIGSTFLAVSTITFSQFFAHVRELLARCDVPARETPLYMNVFRLTYALAWTVGPALAAWVMVLYSFRGTFAVAAAVFALLGLLVFCFIPAAPPPATLNAAARVPLRRALRRPDIFVSFLAFVFVSAASALCMINLPLFVLDALKGTPGDIGVIYSLAPIFELPLMFYFGLRASRGDHDRVIQIGFALAIAYYGSLSLVQAPWHIYPLQILGAATTAVTSGVAITYFQNHLPGQAGTATNLFSSAGRFGSMTGFLLFGWLARDWGHRALLIVGAGLAATAFGLLTYLMSTRRLEPRVA
jgi:SET family sugar efflux transporter-like MFS transporter